MMVGAGGSVGIPYRADSDLVDSFYLQVHIQGHGFPIHLFPALETSHLAQIQL